MAFPPLKSVLLSALMAGFAAGPVMAADTMKEWTDEVRQEFAAKLRYPREARAQQATGTVKVRVRVAPTGAIKGFEIVEHSGNELLDAAALDLVARVDPLPALPNKDASYAFVIPLSYRFADAGASEAPVMLERITDEMDSWREVVERRVARRKSYPQYLINRGVEGQVKLRIDVAADGTVTDSQVMQSSGSTDLDEEALLLAADLDLPKLPEGRESFSLVLPLRYEIAETRRVAFSRR